MYVYKQSVKLLSHLSSPLKDLHQTYTETSHSIPYLSVNLRLFYNMRHLMDSTRGFPDDTENSRELPSIDANKKAETLLSSMPVFRSRQWIIDI